MRLDQPPIPKADVPRWLADFRKVAFDVFSKLEPPRETEEIWRYLDLGFNLDDYEAVDAPGDELEDADPIGTALSAFEGSLVIDGHLRTSGSESVMSLQAALQANPQAVRRALEEGVPADLDQFAAAHRAFSPDLALVEAPAGSRSANYVEVQAATPDRVTFPHVAVEVGENAETTVVVNYRSPNGTDRVVIPDVDLAIGPGANAAVVVIQGWGDRTRSISHVRARLDRDSRLTFAEAGLGSALSRLHLTVDLEGSGSEVSVLGLYFGERDQVLDYRAFINHRGRSTISNMLLKGAVEDRARSVFTGLIKIWNEAVRARAFQTNRNLVLSEGAQAQSVPNLEILCDDVMCGHASASGPLDPEHLYYLLSRGLIRSKAEQLLVRAFFNEVLARLPVAEVAAPLRTELSRKFMTAQEEGRL